jgi:Tfp pilus assembly protein PilF
MVRLVSGAAFFLAVSGCSRSESRPAKEEAQPVHDPTAAAESSQAPERPEPTEPREAKRDLPQPNEEAARRYVEAIRAGRERTQAQDYEEAVVAYTAALAAIPGDARALSGRGYARLLAGRFDEAEGDLRAALAAGPPSKLEAAIEFNFGMLEERRGNDPEAERHFTRSWQLRPTKAAREKLRTTDSAPCPGVELTHEAPIHHAGWLSLWRSMNETLKVVAGDGASEVPADDAAAKNSLCEDDACSGDPPWVVVLRPDASTWEQHAVAVVKPASPGLWSTHPEGQDAACGFDSAGASFVPEIERGRWWTVTLDHGCDQYDFECEDDETARVYCEKNFYQVGWRTVLVLDPTTFERRFSLTTSGSADDWFGESRLRFETRVEFEGDDLRIEGPCSAQVKL